MPYTAARAILATAVVALVLAAAVSRLGSGAAWQGLAPADCAEYCEASDRCAAFEARAAVQQPANTWSNLAYVLVAMLVAFGPPMPGRLPFAGSCLLLGLGSFAFHASMTRAGQWIDVAGMMVVLAALAARAVHVGFGVPSRVALPLWAIASALLAAFKWQVDTHMAMAALGGIVAAGAVAGRASGRDLAAAVALLAAGYAVRELDVRRVWCDPASLWQGHALWHLLSAASLGLAWRAFRPPPNVRTGGLDLSE